MRHATVRTLMGLGLLLCGGVVGCLTTNPSAPFKPETPNPFVAEILKQEVLIVKQNGVVIKMDLAAGESRGRPPRNPAANTFGRYDAREAISVERHGFSCQAGVRDEYSDCLYCTIYRRKSAVIADRVTVKFYLEQKRVVDVVVIVEHDIKRGTGLWPEF